MRDHPRTRLNATQSIETAKILEDFAKPRPEQRAAAAVRDAAEEKEDGMTRG